jgi:putative spermidine/putrescine transport system permease protein
MSGYRPGPLAVACAILVAAFLLMPLLAVVPVSFTPARFLSMPGADLSLRHYRELFENPAWGQGVLLSLKIGIVASVVATGFAVMFGLGIWMLRPRFTAVLVGFVLLPMVVPPVVSALTLYFLLTGLSKLNDVVGYDTWLGVALAHVVMIAPFAVVLILVALSQVDRRIDLAARGLGASVAQRAVRVILPNIRFGILTALLLSFVLSWEEIGVTLFVSSVNAVTLPRLMWMGLRDNIDPAIAAISVLLITLTVTVLLTRLIVRRLLSRRRLAKELS